MKTCSLPGALLQKPLVVPAKNGRKGGIGYDGAPKDFVKVGRLKQSCPETNRQRERLFVCSAKLGGGSNRLKVLSQMNKKFNRFANLSNPLQSLFEGKSLRKDTL
jgi:hypothetical protein